MDDVTYYNPNDISAILLAPHAAFTGIATFFLILRLYVVRGAGKALTFDEYVCTVALLANYMMLFGEGYCVHYGLGRTMADLVEPIFFLKGILAIEVTYGIACPVSKLAVLTMYYRIFSASRVIRHSVWVIGFMLMGWGIAVVVVSIFSCTPIEAFWDRSIPGYCIDSDKFYIGITVPNIIFDFLTVALPVYEVWSLQMGRDKKLAISGVFLLGGSVILASFARLALFSIYKPGGGPSGNNISQTVVLCHVASAIETPLAIIGACLPPCAPLLKRLFGGVTGTISGKRSRQDGQSAEPKGNLHSIVTIGKISNRSGGRQKRNKLDTVTDFDPEGSFVRLEDGHSEGGVSTEELTGGGYGARNGNSDCAGGLKSKRRSVMAGVDDADIQLKRFSTGQ
ncbi:hypothetical protein QBC37DRAFT_468827 [Rhypophila decipiens]|uniref:Rhodopsin domain-containing protein n=1 Tax=Rhypophila decipiens TaxID=261697 RepID=A0AAN6YPA0_9PEZI|nr:hypothetical protein QBC37DRAFT_468827 [Rhypophila decipiens]